MTEQLHMDNALNQTVLTDFLQEELGLDPADASETTELFSTGRLDSFAVADLLVFLETRGGFEISPDEVVIENFDSIHKIMHFVQVKRAG